MHSFLKTRSKWTKVYKSWSLLVRSISSGRILRVCDRTRSIGFDKIRTRRCLLEQRLELIWNYWSLWSKISSRWILSKSLHFKLFLKHPVAPSKAEKAFFFLYTRLFKVRWGVLTTIVQAALPVPTCWGFFFFFFIAGLRGSEAFPLPTSICFSNLSSHGDLVMPGVLLWKLGQFSCPP